MPAARCVRHVHKSSQDFRPNGRCIHCQHEAQKRYWESCRDARRREREQTA